MAGRIRTIKPELLEDEKTARLTSREWRLFVSSLLLADDYGNFRASAKWLHGQIFWGEDEVSVNDTQLIINGICEVGLFDSYESNGQPYLHISGWEKHQRVDKPGKPRVPGPYDKSSYQPKHDSMLYAVRQGNDGPIKIGKAWDVEARIARLQTATPHPLKLLAKSKDGYLEKEIHEQLQEHRMKGEWFTPDPEVLRVVSRIDSGTSRESVANDSGTSRESVANDSGTSRESVANHSRLTSDLRPTTNDQRPTINDQTSGKQKSKKEIQEVVDYYKTKNPSRGRQLKPGHSDWKRIEDRLTEGYSVEELKQAIDGNLIDKWHVKNRKHSVEFVFRNSTKVEGFIDVAKEGNPTDTPSGPDYEYLRNEL